MNRIPIKERFFEVIEDQLYVFDLALREAGISVSYYQKEKCKGNRRLIFLDHPENKKFNLVAYETMGDGHKQKIVERFKNPYDFVVDEPIRRMIIQNQDARKFFLSYRHNGDKMLPIHRVRQYSRACDILDLIKRLDAAKNKPIKELGIKMPTFFAHLKKIIESEIKNGESEKYEGDNQLHSRFPSSYQRLRDKADLYTKESFACVIEKNIGNSNNLKVKDEVAEAQLLSLIEDPHQYDDVMSAFLYNSWAKANDYPMISPVTVGLWRRKKEHLIIMGREGNEALNEKYLRQVKGSRPSAPLYLVEHDDNNLDFLFSDMDGYNYNKYVAITVKDSHCDLLLGKSYIVGKTPEQEQVYHAYIDAMYYIRSLTGGWHMPFELKSDRWAHASLTPFYQSIGNWIPPAHKNKHRGYIEQSFGSKLWKRAQQLVSQDNWSGNNISAKYPGVNRQFLEDNVKNRPLIGSEAELQIEKFFHLLRHMPDIKRSDMNAASKEQQWLQSWEQLSIEQKRPISDEQFLLTFGLKHSAKHTNGIKITNRGVEPQIKNVKYSYDLPESWMYDKYIGASVQIVYDPFDMSRVLVTNHDDIRFIAKTAQLIPRALKDQYTNSRTYLNAILEEKGDQVARISKAAEKRSAIVDRSYYNAEAMLQGGAVLPKELKNETEHLYIERPSTESTYDPLAGM